MGIKSFFKELADKVDHLIGSGNGATDIITEMDRSWSGRARNGPRHYQGGWDAMTSQSRDNSVRRRDGSVRSIRKDSAPIVLRDPSNHGARNPTPIATTSPPSRVAAASSESPAFPVSLVSTKGSLQQDMAEKLAQRNSKARIDRINEWLTANTTNTDTGSSGNDSSSLDDENHATTAQDRRGYASDKVPAKDSASSMHGSGPSAPVSQSANNNIHSDRSNLRSNNAASALAQQLDRAKTAPSVLVSSHADPGADISNNGSRSMSLLSMQLKSGTPCVSREGSVRPCRLSSPSAVPAEFVTLSTPREDDREGDAQQDQSRIAPEKEVILTDTTKRLSLDHHHDRHLNRLSSAPVLESNATWKTSKREQQGVGFQASSAGELEKSSTFRESIRQQQRTSTDDGNTTGTVLYHPQEYYHQPVNGITRTEWDRTFVKRWKAVKKRARLQALGLRSIWKVSSPDNRVPELLTSQLPNDVHGINNMSGTNLHHMSMPRGGSRSHMDVNSMARDPSLATMLLGDEVCEVAC